MSSPAVPLTQARSSHAQASKRTALEHQRTPRVGKALPFSPPIGWEPDVSGLVAVEWSSRRRFRSAQTGQLSHRSQDPLATGAGRELTGQAARSAGLR